ncbi:MAG: J domain-containing protein [Alphaproteobacteria bacterium]|nr:J domain-containing protein [Alphaproteobacteria bacterium]
MRDPYDTLGVPRTASADDIKKAYRQLAKKLHPDLNPGNAKAAAQFKEVSAANDLLSDPEKRARFDRGEIDASGAEVRRRPSYRSYAESPGGAKYSGGIDPEDIFEEFFSGRQPSGNRSGSGFRSGFKARGADVAYEMKVDFLDAARGAKRRLTLPDGKVLDVTIPPGSHDGQQLRLKGQGTPGLGGGAAGDAYIQIEVSPHPYFRREGVDIHLELPVTLSEAVAGAKIPVPTIDGTVTMTIPKGSNTGSTLRLKGKGVPDGGGRGDQYVRLTVVLPEGVDAELERFVQNWGQRDYDVRGKLGGPK